MLIDVKQVIVVEVNIKLFLYNPFNDFGDCWYDRNRSEVRQVR